MKICPKCAAENADTAKFCNECGASLEITDAEVSETVNNTEPVPETPKEDTSPVENEESTPVTIAETVTDSQESATEQTETKEEPAPKKRNRLIIGVVAAALICIIGFMATRTRLKSLEVTYTGDTANGVVLDNDNKGFTVMAVYSNGNKEIIPPGEWQIKEPQTLESDSSCNVTITYKNKHQDINVKCSTTRLQYITATYSGSCYEGTVVNNKSDITVIGTFGNGQTKEYDNTIWYLEPSTTTLKKGVDNKITVSIDFSDGPPDKMSTDLIITGLENKLESITASYNGSEYEGTKITKDSDISVYGLYSDGSKKKIDKEKWSLEPKEVTLKNGETITVKVVVAITTLEFKSTELSITGKEKPFTPEIEGDHYNCTPEQFKKYTNTHSNLTLKETTSKYFDGDDYTSYIATSTSSSIEPTGLALKTNEDGKVCSMIVIATDGTTGIAESLNFASVFDKSIDLDDRSKMADLILYKVYNTDNTVIVMDNNTVEDGYLFYIMTKEYFDNNFKQ